MYMIAIRALLMVVLTLAAGQARAAQYFVDADAAPGGDGAGWATAFDTLDGALALVVPGDRVWVAEGVYGPTIERIPGDPRSATFFMPSGVHLYGGFDGTESQLSDRAGLFSTTILDGDVAGLGPAGSCYHVVHVEHPSGVPMGGNRLDGFVIQNGNASGGAPGFSFNGGGVLALNVALRLTNVTLRNNSAIHGAGVHAQPGLLTMIDCVVEGNRAAEHGGAVWGRTLQLTVLNTVMRNNSAGARGGAVYVHSISNTPDIVLFANCLIHDNFAPIGGGAFIGGGQFTSGAASFRNCTIAYNSASSKGGGIRANTDPVNPARVVLANTIVWENRAPVDPGLSGRAVISYCNMQDNVWSSAFGNFEADPRFVDPAGRDLHVELTSPCIDAGSNDLIALDYIDLDGDGDRLEPMPFDLDRRDRRIEVPSVPTTGAGAAPVVDIGAYERPSR